MWHHVSSQSHLVSSWCFVDVPKNAQKALLCYYYDMMWYCATSAIGLWSVPHPLNSMLLGLSKSDHSAGLIYTTHRPSDDGSGSSPYSGLLFMVNCNAPQIQPRPRWRRWATRHSALPRRVSLLRSLQWSASKLLLLCAATALRHLARWRHLSSRSTNARNA